MEDQQQSCLGRACKMKAVCPKSDFMSVLVFSGFVVSLQLQGRVMLKRKEQQSDRFYGISYM